MNAAINPNLQIFSKMYVLTRGEDPILTKNGVNFGLFSRTFKISTAF